MTWCVCRLTVLGGLASLSIIPSPVGSAGTLRDEASGYRILGYEAQRRGDYQEALIQYRKAAALDPTYATPHNDVGVMLEEQGRLEEALDAYEQALAVDPTYLAAHANLASLYERMGEREKAVYHWLKRYRLGDPADPWTARAEERLAALRVLETYPGLKGQLFTRRRVVEQQLESHARSLEAFHALTDARDEWP